MSGTTASARCFFIMAPTCSRMGNKCIQMLIQLRENLPTRHEPQVLHCSPEAPWTGQTVSTLGPQLAWFPGQLLFKW